MPGLATPLDLRVLAPRRAVTHSLPDRHREASDPTRLRQNIPQKNEGNAESDCDGEGQVDPVSEIHHWQSPITLYYSTHNTKKSSNTKKPYKIWLFSKKSSARCWRLLTFPMKSIISSTGLNFSVRNGKRCGPCDKSPTLKT